MTTTTLTNLKQIQTGDIGLVHSHGFLPEAIQEFQGDEYNHALIFVWIGHKLWCFEAIKEGCAFTDFNEYLKKQDAGECSLLVLKPINDEMARVKYDDFIDFVLPLTHKPYGFFNLLVLQAIKFIGVKLGKLFGKEWDWWLGGKNNTRRFICGELVAYIYNHFLKWFPNWYKLAPMFLHISDKFKHALVDIKPKK